MKNLIMAALLVSPSLLAAEPDYKTLLGTWQVDAVHVDTSGVQAVVDNDPKYMGAEVTFSADNILWTKGTPQQPIDAASDNCQHTPTLTSASENDPEDGYQIAGGFNVICGDQPWGPNAVITLPKNDRMTLYWYDGAILSMKKLIR